MCVSACNHKSSIIRRPWPTRGSCAMVKKILLLLMIIVIIIIVVLKLISPLRKPVCPSPAAHNTETKQDVSYRSTLIVDVMSGADTGTLSPK